MLMIIVDDEHYDIMKMDYRRQSWFEDTHYIEVRLFGWRHKVVLRLFASSSRSTPK